MFREVVFQGHFPDFEDIISHLSIFLPMAFTKTTEFIILYYAKALPFELYNSILLSFVCAGMKYQSALDPRALIVYLLWSLLCMANFYQLPHRHQLLWPNILRALCENIQLPTESRVLIVLCDIWLVYSLLVLQTHGNWITFTGNKFVWNQFNLL